MIRAKGISLTLQEKSSQYLQFLKSKNSRQDTGTWSCKSQILLLQSMVSSLRPSRTHSSQRQVFLQCLHYGLFTWCNVHPLAMFAKILLSCHPLNLAQRAYIVAIQNSHVQPKQSSFSIILYVHKSCLRVNNFWSSFHYLWHCKCFVLA